MNKNLLNSIVCGMVMFAMIFVTFVLTGGRETYDFTVMDKFIFVIFIISEIITLGMLIYYISKYTKNLRNGSNSTMEPEEQRELSPLNSKIIICSAILTIVLITLGILIGIYASNQTKAIAEYVFSFSLIFVVFMFPFNMLTEKIILHFFKNKKVDYWQNYFVAHRENIEKKKRKLFLNLKISKLFSNIYTALLGLAGILFSLSAGISPVNDGIIYLIFPTLIFTAVLSRIKFTQDKELFKHESYVSQEDYPELYRLARRAADISNCKKNIKIALTGDCNAGIMEVGDTYSVQIGVILLDILSEEELVCIFLHEFEHVTLKNKKINKCYSYNTWISSGCNNTYLSWLTNVLFSFPDGLYNFRFNLYQYAASLCFESDSDKAMLKSGKPECAASALLKIDFYNKYEWERDAMDFPCLYEPESCENYTLRTSLNSFKELQAERKELWIELAKKEIQSRSSSHPILSQRFKMLGIEKYSLLGNEKSPALKEEAEKAIDFIDILIKKQVSENYSELREEYYIKQKNLVENWEQEGKPIIAEQYSSVIEALNILGRRSEIEELCDRVISETPIHTAAYAYFIKGFILLHKFDEQGLEYVYKAIYDNHNYIDGGLGVIGHFCCLTGNQKELDLYRERAVDLAQKNKDIYSCINVIQKNDKLSPEKLPEGMLDEILSFISSIDEGEIKRIYLLRKTINENFTVSDVIIRFSYYTDENTKGRIMDKIFRFLDTFSSHQFGLFDYNGITEVSVEKIPGALVWRAEENTDVSEE
ncbi:MAG: hypothetical protein E7480_03550 [Ruminococcaceae bacterium]|nr:hypothetical protein [Oscillospiraceae bacterium]